MYARWLLPACVVGAAVAAVAHPWLTGGELLGSDLLKYFLPMLGLMEGRIPVLEAPALNPYVAGGNPYWADMQTQVLYPPAWFFSLASPPPAVLMYLAFHAGVATWGTARMLRALRLSPVACCAGALAWSLSPWLIQHQVHLTFVAVAAWTPWIGERFRLVMTADRAWEHAPQLAVLFSVAVLASSPDMILLGAIPLLAILLWDVDHRGVAVALRRGLWVAACAAVALLLTAPMWIPSLRWVPHSIRPMMVSAGVRPFPLLPPTLLRLLAPGMLGNPLANYSGPGAGGEEETFPGLLALLAVPLALHIPRRIAAWGGFLVVTGYLLGFTTTAVAGVNRVPSRFAVVSIFGATLLGAAVVDVARSAGFAALRGRLAAWAVALAFAQLTFGRTVEHIDDAAAAFAASSVVATALTLLLCAAGVAWVGMRGALGAVLILLAVGGHGAHNAWIQQEVSPAGTYARPGAARPAIRQAGGFMLDAQPASHLVNFGSAWHVATLRGYSPLAPRATWDVLSRLDGHPNPASDGTSALSLIVRHPYSSAWEQLGVGSVLDMA
ncbi:MAG: hypothetical protein AB2A00_11480, partial [Myxococcota bacterium]